jgi:hypothetical protein
MKLLLASMMAIAISCASSEAAVTAQNMFVDAFSGEDEDGGVGLFVWDFTISTGADDFVYLPTQIRLESETQQEGLEYNILGLPVANLMLSTFLYVDGGIEMEDGLVYVGENQQVNLIFTIVARTTQTGVVAASLNSLTYWDGDELLPNVERNFGTLQTIEINSDTDAVFVAAIPEPSVAFLGLVGSLGFLRRRR